MGPVGDRGGVWGMTTPVRMATRVGVRYTCGAWWGDGCPHGVLDAQGPTTCGRCGAAFSGPAEFPHVSRHAGSQLTYDTEDGRLHPGDMYWVAHYRSADGTEWCPGKWTNCDGQRLHVQRPNGIGWDIDGRANNCTLPDETTHRCWVREGEPPLVTVGKAGHTCSAGAGSIASGGYHGFLQAGVLNATFTTPKEQP